MLISDDLPTFDRPIKAYSGFTGGGNRGDLGVAAQQTRLI
jgi:hypothetical protein